MKLSRVALLLILAFSMSACISNRARRNALLPAIQNAWAGIRLDAQVGEVAEGVLAEMDIAIRTGNPVSIKRLWAQIKPGVENGIELKVIDNEVSVGVADSLIERARQFDAAVQQYSQRRLFE